jgi:hypothetical protein
VTVHNLKERTMPDTDTGTAAAAEVTSEKSEGQQMLDRMLATSNRLIAIRRRLDEVRGSVTMRPSPPQGHSQTAGGAGGAGGSRSTTFFGGLNGLAEANERIAEQLSASVEDLARLF